MPEELLDLTFYTSDRHYEDGAPSRIRTGLSHAGAAEEIRLFGIDFHTYLDSGRLIVAIDPHTTAEVPSDQAY